MPPAMLKDSDSLTSSNLSTKRGIWRYTNYNQRYVNIDKQANVSAPPKNCSMTSLDGIDQSDLSIDVNSFQHSTSDCYESRVLSNEVSTNGGLGMQGIASMASSYTYNFASNLFRMPSVSLDSHFMPDVSVFMRGVLSKRRHEDLKELLESNKDQNKLEAMKRIIGMIAKGKDAGELFPQVVKNVVSKNVEVKKLVYVYLERYAEEQQDLALLSVATFQKALKDPNQLIRASALRVLSSIRVSVITPIMLLAIKDACADMSPFVRKSAANAIPKLYSLDEDTKEELILAIEKLLGDKTTLVAGSAIYAFEQLCPGRLDLVHKHYRRLCSLLVDVDEWGQVVVANMLIRYAKTQFLDPNQGDIYEEELDQNKTSDDPSKFFADTSSEESEDEKESVASSEKPARNVMDPDHRLLLRNSKPLLQSRNSAVVMTVCQMYYYLAPRSEINCIVKPMIRLLKSHREIQAIVLNTLVTFSKKHKGLVEPYLKSFYIRANDPTHVKLLKLEILTNLASETSIGIILKEFQAYVHSSDPKFVAATIYAIGRCATAISEVSDQCLHGLMGLMGSKNEIVVAESVVVTKKLLQQKPDENLAVIVHMAKMIDNITIPMARASILWMIGENCDKVHKYAPDVLRKFAKSFPNEEDIVKLQVVNLAAKLFVTNSKQVKLLVQYVLNLAKYDENYDVRDRARLIRNLIIPTNGKNNINKHAKKILFCEKPAPVLSSKFQTRNEFRMNTLSHYLNQRCAGYEELPDWPEEKPDPTVRNVEPPPPEPAKSLSSYEKEDSKPKGKADKLDKSKKKSKGFYSDEDEESESEEEKEASEDEEDEESDEDSDASTQRGKKSARNDKKSAVKKVKKKSSDDESEEGSDEDSDEEEEKDSDEDDSEEDESEEESEPDSDVEEVKNQKVKGGKGDVKNIKSSKSKLKKESDSEEVDDDEETSENGSSDDQQDSKVVQQKLPIKGKQQSAVTSSTKGSSNQSLVGSNRSSPSPSKPTVKGVSNKRVERVSESETESEDSEAEKKKSKQMRNSAKKEKDKAPSSSGKTKTKSSSKKELEEETPTIIQEASLLSFDDEPTISAGDVPASAPAAMSESRPSKPMYPSLLSQTSEDRTAGVFSSGGLDSLEVLPSSPSAIHSAQQEVDLLNRLLGRGLSLKARFTRKPFIYDENKVSIELIFSNTATDSNTTFSNISIVDKKLPAGMSLDEFSKIGVLGAGQKQNAYIGIDFCDSLQPAVFSISCTLNDTDTKLHSITISCSVGDLMRPCTCSEQYFLSLQGRLSGMNENECRVEVAPEVAESESEILRRVYSVCNVGLVPSTQQSVYLFTGKTVSCGTPVLVMLNLQKQKLRVNCEKMVIGSKLMKELRDSLAHK